MIGKNTRKTVTVTLNGFSLSVLDAAAPAGGWSPEQTVELALRHYLADRKLRPPGWACLPLPEGADDPNAPERSIEVELDDPTMQTIAREAEAQAVSIETLVTHAVMYLWAAEHPSPAGSQVEEQPGVRAGGSGDGTARPPVSRRAS
jgi:hypothetical protein